ncbi:hypothetical protein DMH04_00380 [Kibdelosporangium aridum]|uniref:Uncharacterized protein n=1 Tax=Kibdelosporangium aridum TaxID=2030 RepID=A0A428ZTU2_KIBAR|nr:hypothetical protein [Kibdelosporangium aridum]RSM91499.1 hypothetical protein DMH04_00380 [Kibdelosporangium aridum]
MVSRNFGRGFYGLVEEVPDQVLQGTHIALVLEPELLAEIGGKQQQTVREPGVVGVVECLRCPGSGGPVVNLDLLGQTVEVGNLLDEPFQPCRLSLRFHAGQFNGTRSVDQASTAALGWPDPPA